jgi:hypothetical protein
MIHGQFAPRFPRADNESGADYIPRSWRAGTIWSMIVAPPLRAVVGHGAPGAVGSGRTMLVRVG